MPWSSVVRDHQSQPQIFQILLPAKFHSPTLSGSCFWDKTKKYYSENVILSKGKTSKSMYTVTFTSSAPFLPVCSTYSGEYMNKKLFIWLRNRWRYCRHMFAKINRPRLTFILSRLAHPYFVNIMEVFGASVHIVFSSIGVDYLILQ